MAILEDPVTVALAAACTWISNVLCVYLIVQHIRNYTQPQFQRYICRIIFIVPFYCTASWLALHHREHSLFFETPRDCYEAWVIYNFMALCMAYVGGPGAVVVKSEGKLIQPSWVLCTCCMKPIPVDGFFLRNCKQGTLQFVIIKPLLAFMTLVLFAMDLYQMGNWSLADGYVWEVLIYNFCYSLALFWMLLFYVGTEDLLKPYKPLLKFFVFKTVIFLTFWQGMGVTFIATRLGWTPEDSEAMQNWLICVEMLFAAVGMLFAFPHTEYQLGGRATPGFKWEAFKHAISISDVLEDIYLQFNPNYKSYVLHTDGGPSENVKRKKFRGKKQRKPAFTVIQRELGALGDKVIKMSKLKPSDRRRLEGVSGELGDVEEGGVWHSAAPKTSVLTEIQTGLQNSIQVLTDKPREALQSWLPQITETERKQAELLDSDSDAAYDDEMHHDNQLDDEVLTSSDDDDPSGRPRGGRMQALDSSSDGEGYTRQDTATNNDRWTNDGGGGTIRSSWPARFPDRGTVTTKAVTTKGPRQDDSWAVFPDENGRFPGQEDSSWAQFPPPDSAAAAEQAGSSTGAAASAAAATGTSGSGHAGSQADAARASAQAASHGETGGSTVRSHRRSSGSSKRASRHSEGSVGGDVGTTSQTHGGATHNTVSESQGQQEAAVARGTGAAGTGTDTGTGTGAATGTDTQAPEQQRGPQRRVSQQGKGQGSRRGSEDAGGQAAQVDASSSTQAAAPSSAQAAASSGQGEHGTAQAVPSSSGGGSEGAAAKQRESEGGAQ